MKAISRRINSIAEIETFGQLSAEKQKQLNRFTIKNNEIILQEIEKSKFAQINGKRYYFSNSIVSLLFCHPNSYEIVHFKVLEYLRTCNILYLINEPCVTFGIFG